MLDISFIRENIDAVKAAVRNKNRQGTVDIDQLLEVDQKRRSLQQEVEECRSERNNITAQIKTASTEDRQALIDEANTLKQKLQPLEDLYNEVLEQFNEQILLVPNVTDPRMPIGKDESENVVLRKWGEPKQFSFDLRDHVEIGKDLDLIDIERSAPVSGARFYYLKNEAVLLQFALVQLTFETLTNEETLKEISEKAGLKISSKPFSPIIPPVIMRADTMQKMDRYDPADERFVFEKDNLVLVGSAEHTLGPYHMKEVLEETELPKRYIGYSTAFRREAGSYGQDTRGILRVHQFDKLEIESFTSIDQGSAEQEFIVALQEHLVQQLDIPYQVIQICTGDTGKPDYQQYDIECWVPTQGKYRETHTSDYMTDFQSRRLNTRYKDSSGKKQFVHMNDATAFAIPRILIAILENHQQEDGSVSIPEPLQRYTGISSIKPKRS